MKYQNENCCVEENSMDSMRIRTEMHDCFTAAFTKIYVARSELFGIMRVIGGDKSEADIDKITETEEKEAKLSLDEIVVKNSLGENLSGILRELETNDWIIDKIETYLGYKQASN